jgi:hypothetical protein
MFIPLLPIVVGVDYATRTVAIHERQTSKHLCDINFGKSNHPRYEHPPLHMHQRILGKWIMTHCQEELVSSGLDVKYFN